MKVIRVVPNLRNTEPEKAQEFYGDVLGLDLLMDHGWLQTYGAPGEKSAQVTLASQGGSGMPVPELSIEVDDLDTALQRARDASLMIEYGPEVEEWGVRRFFVRDPFGRLINILQHL